MSSNYSVYSENEIALVLRHPAMDYRELLRKKILENEILPSIIYSHSMLYEKPILETLKSLFWFLKDSAQNSEHNFYVLPYQRFVHTYFLEKGIPFTYLYPDFSLIRGNALYTWEYMLSLSLFEETPQCRKLKLDTFNIAALGRDGFSRLVTFDKRKLKDITHETRGCYEVFYNPEFQPYPKIP